MTELERFLNKVAFADACWLWTGAIQGDGYGSFKSELGTLAHRISYLYFVGEIRDGYTIDHLCRVRHCVNPDHLEAVTPAVNILRGVGMGAKNAVKTHCKRGHEFTPENTWSNGGNPKWRQCRQCVLDARRAKKLAS